MRVKIPKKHNHTDDRPDKFKAEIFASQIAEDMLENNNDPVHVLNAIMNILQVN